MLSQTVDRYLAVRRSLGFKLTNVEIYLNSFAQFAAARGDTHITVRSAIDWASQSKSESQRATRLNTVVRLAQFSQAEDTRHEVPPDNVFCRHRNRPRPYIYTQQEIQALMTEALKLNPVNSLRPHLYNTLIGLLAATGLRISEALSLRFDCITKEGLVIRETKFHKTRLLPLHETTRGALERYVMVRKKIDFADDHLFVSRKRRRLSKSAVYTTFHQLLIAAGISNKPGQPRPRLIDFRHTFATTSLADCPNSRDHVGSHLLALQTYMGHAHVGCTYWYLENTPHLMRDIAQACSLFVEENTK
jgi:integrase